MSAIQKGAAIVWSVGTVTYTAGIVSSSNPEFVQSTRFSRTSEKTEIKDYSGVIKTQVFHGFKKSLSMTVIPTGSNIAGALASFDAHCLKPGTTVTVADADGAMLTEASYNVISSTQGRTVDGVATVDIELEQGDESNDLTTAVS